MSEVPSEAKLAVDTLSDITYDLSDNREVQSMISDRISIRVGTHIRKQLQRLAKATRKRESQLVREVLESYLRNQGKDISCYDLAMKVGFIGSARNLPRDASTNKKYLRGFGKSL